jgi:hypothetical protein
MSFGQPISFRDVTLFCVSCGEPFTFTPSQQIEYADRGWGEPRRCPECRQRRHKTTKLSPRQPEDIDPILARAQKEIERWRQAEAGHQGVPDG